MSFIFPLPALLSQALVAFTIEFDNEAENQMPHRTARFGAKAGSLHAPWLVSMAMWFNCMKFVDESGITARELERRARTKTNLPGMERWRYVTIAPDPTDRRPKPPRSAWLIRATPAGLKAREVWEPLFGSIEKRWEQRFGKREIDQLRQALQALSSQFDIDLPDCLPILGYGLFSLGTETPSNASARSEPPNSPPLSLAALLSRPLLVFAMEFERESGISLAICANILRVLNDKGVRLRDLPQLSGVSKEAIRMAMGILRKKRLAEELSDPSASRGKIVRLTASGRKAQDSYVQLLARVEARWLMRYGKATIAQLRESLQLLVGDATADHSPLFRALEPYPNGWRASVPKPATLPHFPMVLHRGGYPDGS